MDTTNNIVNRLKLLKDDYEYNLEQTEGEITESIEAIEKEILELQDTAENKVNSIMHVHSEMAESQAMLDGQIEYYKTKLSHAKAKQKSFKQLDDSLKFLLKRLLNELGIKKLNTPKGTVSIRMSEAVEILDEELALESLPKEYVVETITHRIDKVPLKKHLKALGDDISYDGVALRKNQNIQIK